MEERIEQLEKKVAPFPKRAQKHDEDGTFPFENFKDLKEIGYQALTIPKKYGGAGISLYEMIRLQEVIGASDGSTALSIGWHMGITKHLGEDRKSTRLNSSHVAISYAVFCLKKKKHQLARPQR